MGVPVTSTRTNHARGRRGLVDSATVRALFLAPLVRELAGSGVAVDSFLSRYGLSAAQLSHLYERVPLRQFVALAEAAAERLERPFLGLELGARFVLSDLGPFYALFILARDLQSALVQLTRFQSAWQTNTLFELVRGPSTSACHYCIQDLSIWPRLQDAEFALASLATFVRELTHKRWRPLAVEFEHDVSDRAAALGRFFAAPVQGNCAVNRLIFDNTDLRNPVRWRLESQEHDVVPILERHLMELLRSEEVAAPQSVAERVDSLIARKLGRADIGIESAAAEMKMSVRSLRRHLAEEGTTFRQLLQVHRRTAIEAVLNSNGARLSDLANRMSYSDSAVLSRAFKNWTGISPSAYARMKKR
jgi:AraC-like DNA-binding protein